MAKKEKTKEIEQEEEMAIVPASENVEIAPAEEKPEEKPKDEKPRQTFGQVVMRILVFLLQLIVFLAILGGIGAAAYFGLPIVYERYIRPVEQNTSQLNDLKFRQDRSDIQITDLQTRLATLESGQTTQSDSLTDLDSRVQTLAGADIQRNESLIELTYQSDLLRAMELLSRARLFLYQSNFGLARSDVQAARDILAEMQATAPESKQKDLTEALFRLDLALQNLPDFPVAASDDLDIAWQILMDGYPVAPTATPTPIPTLPPEATATPASESTATPTAFP
jgi:cell division protein FtsB